MERWTEVQGLLADGWTGPLDKTMTRHGLSELARQRGSLGKTEIHTDRDSVQDRWCSGQERQTGPLGKAERHDL